MNFYTKVMIKLGVNRDLVLTVKVESRPQAGSSQQKIDEVRSALRELVSTTRSSKANSQADMLLNR